MHHRLNQNEGAGRQGVRGRWGWQREEQSCLVVSVRFSVAPGEAPLPARRARSHIRARDGLQLVQLLRQLAQHTRAKVGAALGHASVRAVGREGHAETGSREQQHAAASSLRQPRPPLAMQLGLPNASFSLDASLGKTAFFQTMLNGTFPDHAPPHTHSVGATSCHPVSMLYPHLPTWLKNTDPVITGVMQHFPLAQLKGIMQPQAVSRTADKQTLKHGLIMWGKKSKPVHAGWIDREPPNRNLELQT